MAARSESKKLKPCQGPRTPVPVTVLEVMKSTTANLVVDQDDLTKWREVHGVNSPPTGTLNLDSVISGQTVAKLHMQYFAPGDRLLVHDIKRNKVGRWSVKEAQILERVERISFVGVIVFPRQKGANTQPQSDSGFFHVNSGEVEQKVRGWRSSIVNEDKELLSTGDLICCEAVEQRDGR